MAGQAVLAGQVGRLLQVVHGQQLAAQGVFQGQQTGAGKVGVVRLDGGGNLAQRQAAVALVVQGLRLHTAEDCRPTPFPAVTVRHLTHDVLVATLTVRQQGAQVALGTGGQKQRGLKAEQAGDLGLQGVDAGVVGKHVVAQGRCGHGGAHGRCRLGDGVAAQVNPLSGVMGVHGGLRAFSTGSIQHKNSSPQGRCARKLDSRAWPCSLRMLSGWNCTPSTSSVAWRTPMISPSSVQAVTVKLAGQLVRSIASEW